jgi:predicted ABC-type ATPase
LPVLHLIVGPNGAGKTTLYERIVGPATHLPFINADLIARERWPDDAERQAYEAARIAAQAREAVIAKRRSFAAEPVFSHRSKLALIHESKAAGYLVTLHVVMIPVELAVRRVAERAAQGGHSVPVAKVRSRFRRLWKNVALGLPLADDVYVYENTSARRPFRLVARYQQGTPVMEPRWPDWSPLK